MGDLDSTRRDVGRLIQLLRERQGMSQRELSRVVGRSPAYVSKLEAGEHDPSLSRFAALAVALRMNPLECWTVLQIAALLDGHTEGAYSEHSHSTESAGR
jgi:transcriptional regulator with XRE-family HTH domain